MPAAPRPGPTNEVNSLDFEESLREFITLFVVIDPIGSIPVFLFAAQGVPAHLRVRFAIRGVVVATFVL